MALARNDPAQYDELVAAWWDRRGPFAMLHWLAAARAELLPPPSKTGAILLDIACGGGLLAPHVDGYRHVGVDINHSALNVAREHGVQPIRADARALPIATGSVEVVVAGEVLEHVPDQTAVVAEIARVLAPGGTLILDTIAATRLARVVAVTIAERIPGGPPRRLHDPALFVDRKRLVDECRSHGISLRLNGLRPSGRDAVRWLLRRRDDVRLVRSRSTAILFSGVGTKEQASE